MRRNSSFFLGAAACSMMLASCGGNNTPTETPTPTPGETPSPSPSPTPMPIALDSDFTSPTSAIYFFAYFTPNGGIEVFNDASRSNGTAGISYTADPQAVVFGLSQLDAAAEFEAADVVTSTATEVRFAEGDESVLLELPFGNILRATYQRSDAFISGTEPGVLRSSGVAIFRNAVETTDAIAADLTYTGQPEAVGSESGVTLPDAVSAAAATFTVSPGAADGDAPSLMGTITIFEDDNGTPVETAELTIEIPPGSDDVTTDDVFFLANNTFAGDVTDDANGFTGRFSGTLAGPDREEIVVVFSVEHEDGRKYVGSVIGN